MPELTIDGLLKQIELIKNRTLIYAGGTSRLVITHIEYPEGPVEFTRNDSLAVQHITKQQLARITSVCQLYPNYPIHIDRVFSAGGNTRSALETILLHTPNFFLCYPKRVDVYSGEILTNLKHIMWCPDDYHNLGEIHRKEYSGTISEIEQGAGFSDIQIDSSESSVEKIEADRLHVQIQVALVELGRAMGCVSWVAANDRQTQVGKQTISQMNDVIENLEEIPFLFSREMRDAATLIDCIWFTADKKQMPFVFEIENTTGVTSGMTRMKKFYDAIPGYKSTYIVTAPNKFRGKTIREANQPIYRDMQTKYIPYSTIGELHSLIKRYPLTGSIDYKFLYPFLDKVTYS